MNLTEAILYKPEDAVFRIALQELRSAGINTYSFGGLDYLSDKFANVLSESGITQGDVVAVMLPQSASFVVAHLAVLKIGAIVLPIGIDLELTLVKRFLAESQAKSLVIDESLQPESINSNSGSLPFKSIFVAGHLASQKDFGEGFRGFWYAVNFADSVFAIAAAEPSTPAYIFFELPPTDDPESTIVTHGEIIEA